MHPSVEAILAARHARRPLGRLGPAAPDTVAAGYAAQRELAAALGAVPPAGFKIGATTRQMQGILGLDGPAAGFVPASSVNPSGTSFRYADLLAPGVECEIAVRLGRDLPPGPTSAEAAAAAVDAVLPAIELVENRYGPLDQLHTPTLVVDQVFHRSGVLGPATTDWRALDLAGVEGRFHIAGRQVASGHGRDLLGHPMTALAWLAGSPAAEMFGGLRAGQVVWLGSVTPPIWIDGPCRVVAEFDGLGAADLHFV